MGQVAGGSIGQIAGDAVWRFRKRRTRGRNPGGTGRRSRAFWLQEADSSMPFDPRTGVDTQMDLTMQDRLRSASRALGRADPCGHGLTERSRGRTAPGPRSPEAIDR